jgi:hypothetical protein
MGKLVMGALVSGCSSIVTMLGRGKHFGFPFLCGGGARLFRGDCRVTSTNHSLDLGEAKLQRELS